MGDAARSRDRRLARPARFDVCCRCGRGSPSPTWPARARWSWPNDVWIDGRKIAGILVEARGDEWAILGIGVNVALDPVDAPPEVAEIAGTSGAARTRSSPRSTSC